MDTIATNVAWITCVATTTLAATFIQSLILYYEPKNEALGHFTFKQMMLSASIDNKDELEKFVFENLRHYNLQLRIQRDYLSGLRFLRGTAFGALSICSLMLITSVVLFFFSQKVPVMQQESVVEVTRLLALLSLSSVILCVIWIIAYTSHLEMKNPILNAFWLSDLQKNNVPDNQNKVEVDDN